MQKEKTRTQMLASLFFLRLNLNNNQSLSLKHSGFKLIKSIPEVSVLIIWWKLAIQTLIGYHDLAFNGKIICSGKPRIISSLGEKKS